MQVSNTQSGKTHTSCWLDIVESVTVVAAIGGSIASVVTQQIALASIPLSLTATLNMVNRRRHIGVLQAQQHSEMAHALQTSQNIFQSELEAVKQEYEGVQSKFEHFDKQDTQSLQTINTLKDQAEQIEAKLLTLQRTQIEDQTALSNYTQSAQTQFEELSTRLVELQGEANQLQTSTSELNSRVDAQQDNSLSLASQTEGVEELVTILKEIDTLTQIISANPNVASNFYQRGLIRKQLQRLEDQRIAMEDFSQAIRLDPAFAHAYFERGLLKSEFGHKQHAVDDLRTAAKFYFDQGDLTQYEKARDLGQEIHNLIAGSPSPEEETEQFLLENLFG